jgi:hypothetical protein
MRILVRGPTRFKIALFNLQAFCSNPMLTWPSPGIVTSSSTWHHSNSVKCRPHLILLKISGYALIRAQPVLMNSCEMTIFNSWYLSFCNLKYPFLALSANTWHSSWGLNHECRKLSVSCWFFMLTVYTHTYWTVVRDDAFCFLYEEDCYQIT